MLVLRTWRSCGGKLRLVLFDVALGFLVAGNEVLVGLTHIHLVACYA